MAGFCARDYGCTGRLHLNGIRMHNPAFVTPLLSKLWFERGYRGENSIIPGYDGRLVNERRYDAVEIVLPIYITGYANVAGTANIDVWDGFRRNLDFITTNITHPRAAGKDPLRGTMVADYQTPGGVWWTADVKALLTIPDEIEDPTYVIGGLTVSIPAGRFTVGSGGTGGSGGSGGGGVGGGGAPPPPTVPSGYAVFAIDGSGTATVDDEIDLDEGVLLMGEPIDVEDLGMTAGGTPYYDPDGPTPGDEATLTVEENIPNLERDV